jgi:alkylation response protein AidB-like acyl-CoA dehydrogenase
VVNVIADDTEAIRVARALGERFAEGDARRDAERDLPYGLAGELSASGLLAITVPKEHGGAGVTARTVGEVFTELSAGDSSLGQVPQNHFFFVNVLAHAGSEEQQRFFYREVLAGKRFGNAIAERGSRDAHDFRISFTPRPGGGYLLDGAKYYCTGSLFAHWIPVYAKDPGGHRGGHRLKRHLRADRLPEHGRGPEPRPALAQRADAHAARPTPLEGPAHRRLGAERRTAAPQRHHLNERPR